MSLVVANRYVKALTDSFETEKLEKFLENLRVVLKAFEIPEFNSIISSPVVESSKKEELVLSFFDENIDLEFKNFIKILSENKRLHLIPQICSRLNSVIAISKGEYLGQIYSNGEISTSQVKELESLFSKKFSSKIALEYIKSDFDGVRIDIDDLGVEISFSIDRLKHDMSEYILKAI